MGLLSFEPDEIRQLWKAYFGIEASTVFVSCADKQLTTVFSMMTGINISSGVLMGWNREDKFVYTKGKISSLAAKIRFKYGELPVKVCWKSKTEKIYDINDDNIDCDDIKFWLEELDVAKGQLLQNPRWTLLTFIDMVVKDFKERYNLDVSTEFLTCLDKQLSTFFENVTGLKINKEISLELIPQLYSPVFYDTVQSGKFQCILYVNHNWNPITISWDSKSGKKYILNDIQIDCDDIQFRFEGFDAILYIKQFYPKDKLPFKLKDLSYELVVNRINIDCSIQIQLAQEFFEATKSIKEYLESFITTYNTRSEKNERKDGVVHNYYLDSDRLGSICLELDLGSAGTRFLKKLLTSISKRNEFEKIVIE